MDVRNEKENRIIESAIVFLVQKVTEHNSNPKPLILHCIRVGMKLYDARESMEVVVAMLLHDLLEDTQCTPQEIEERFGSRVLQLVDALTFDDAIDDYQIRWKGPLAKMVAIGRDACIMKTVDMHDNLLYLGLFGPKTSYEHTLWKHQFVLKSFMPILADNSLFRAYKSAFTAATERIANTHDKPSS